MTDKLKKVLDLLISEDREQASAALNEWFAEQHNAAVSSLLEAEEVVEEAEDDDKEDLDEDVTITINTDGEEDDFAGEELPVANHIPVAEEGDEDDFGGEEVADEFGAEEVADEVGAEEAPEVELSVDDRVEDLEAQLEALRAQFDEIMGAEDEVEADADDVDADDSDEGEEEGEEEVEEAVEGFTNETFVEEEEFFDLSESHELEPVKAEKLKTEGEEAGDGSKVKVSTDSPIPQKKGTERVGGNPVEIKGKTAKGYERETAPKVAGGSEKFKNSQQEPKKVSKEGDKSAELNKNKEDKKAKSPINGDPKLRGNDLARK